MTDRELLEPAAKAAGIDGDYYVYDGEVFRWGIMSGNELWNPLDDDRDALRLMVKLGISVRHEPKKGYVLAGSSVGIGYKDDPYAATRRAIVRAAAEIGREMK